LLHLASAAEHFSTHPIALSLRAACGEDDMPAAENVEEIPGQGIRAEIDGRTVWVGNTRLMEAAGCEGFVPEADRQESGTVIHVAVDGLYGGYIVISDVIKAHSREAIAAAKRAGVRRTVMLTGDRRSVAEKVAAEIGIDRVEAELLPQDKVACVEALIEDEGGNTDLGGVQKAAGEHSEKRRRVAFVGDGINDAPVLSRADIGIAMGAMGSDAAVEAADVVLMDDDPLRISTAIRISRKCMRIVKQNIWFAIGVKVLCLLLGAVGIANMWLAIFADVGVMVLAVLNAIRCMFIRGEDGPEG
jgi:Cd2+/Zn2+-exporting ATPase